MEGKRFYGLGKIMTRLVDSCETVVTLQLLVLNLERKLRILFVAYDAGDLETALWGLNCLTNWLPIIPLCFTAFSSPDSSPAQALLQILQSN